jgi:hypothetical protein
VEAEEAEEAVALSQNQVVVVEAVAVAEGPMTYWEVEAGEGVGAGEAGWQCYLLYLRALPEV